MNLLLKAPQAVPQPKKIEVKSDHKKVFNFD